MWLLMSDIWWCVYCCQVLLLTKRNCGWCTGCIRPVVLWTVGVRFTSVAALPGEVGRQWRRIRWHSGRLLSLDKAVLWSYTSAACLARYNCNNWQPTRLQSEVCTPLSLFICSHFILYMFHTAPVLVYSYRSRHCMPVVAVQTCELDLSSCLMVIFCLHLPMFTYVTLGPLKALACNIMFWQLAAFSWYVLAVAAVVEDEVWTVDLFVLHCNTCIIL